MRGLSVFGVSMCCFEEYEKDNSYSKSTGRGNCLQECFIIYQH